MARPTGLPTRDAAPQCPITYAEGNETSGYLGGGLFITVQTADDLSFVHSSWEQGIEPWRFNLPTYDWRGPLNVQTVLDRPLFRTGETVSMKHVIRRQELRGLAIPAAADRPGKLKIRHQGSNEEYELALTWDAAGIAESAWPIPKGAKLGRYEIEMEVAGEGGRRPGQMQAVISGGFRVEEFRVPLMRGTLKPPAGPLVAVSEFPLDISVQYLAGGGAHIRSLRGLHLRQRLARSRHHPEKRQRVRIRGRGHGRRHRDACTRPPAAERAPARGGDARRGG